METSPIYFSADVVRRVLNWPMVNDAVATALRAVVAVAQPPLNSNLLGAAPDSPAAIMRTKKNSYVDQPERIITMSGNDPSRLLLTMPAFVGNYCLTSNGAVGDAASLPRQTLACKLVTSYRGNGSLVPPLPSIMANIVLFNPNNGTLEAIMAATDITNWRTVSASLLATKYLYFRRYGPYADREREIEVAIVGCGAQGELHAIGMCANFKVKKINLWNRTNTKALKLSQRLTSQLGAQARTQIEVCSTPRDAVQAADVICIATYSPTALICADDLRNERAIHINAVGAGEVHFGELADSIYREALVYVDCYANAQRELRGLPGRIFAELGEVMLNETYPSVNTLTVFQSMGMASEDACVAQAVQEALLSGNK